MTSPHLKAVIFDIGGVVTRSPLIAIEAFEEHHGLPKNYINCAIASTKGEMGGAWQKFERGEMYLFPFYEAFGRELSDAKRNNVVYKNYCKGKNVDCPKLPESVHIDGRELFGCMMRESGRYNDDILLAIERIRAAKRWAVIALTNNFSKAESTILGVDEATGPPKHLYPDFTLEKELEFLGWSKGVTPPKMRALFDDFCDSSTMGMRKPEKRFYILACKRNNLQPHECVFLDDLGMNLKIAQELGMETIHVPIGGSLKAVQELEKKLGIELTGHVRPAHSKM